MRRAIARPLARAQRIAARAARLILLAGALAGAAASVAGPDTPAPPKVLRYAMRTAETSFDPAAVQDVFSRIILGHVFEGLYGYDPLARPPSIRPHLAAAMPEVADDWRRYTIRIRPGIRFADDPAFGGRPRELVAQDFVYTFERFADPALRSPAWPAVELAGIVGLAEARQRAIDTGKPFDYDAPVAGLRALDRYTLRIELAAPQPRLIELLASGEVYGAVAREVVERYGRDIGAHPVGTGPFRLVQWRRASLIVLERNPGYRETTYDAQPAPDDAEGQALLARFRGRRLPMIDRVEVSIIEQDQARWLAFLNGEADFIERVPEAYIDVAMPGGRLAGDLARRGMRASRQLAADELVTMFNMDDPVVGGVAPERVALRRAVALGIDTAREAQLARRGQMIAAQSIVVPMTSGYDPAFRSEMGDFDPARARALLDLYGYVDRDHDGWREQPDGSPLVLVVATQSDPLSHALAELRKHDMDALGLRTTFRIAQWPENTKAAQAGQLMMWDFTSLADRPDGLPAFEHLYGPAAGAANLARFRLDAFDQLYRRLLVLPDGPEREALFLEAKRLSVAYMPYKIRGHRIVTDMSQPWLVGYRRPVFWQDWWQYVDIVDKGAR
jgi:ABC-type transport system substrate-binding protein